MTHQEIFHDLADDLKNILSTGEPDAWEDLCVEYHIHDPMHPGYVLVAWGEELANARFSVSLHRTDVSGVAGEKLYTASSESLDLHDLETAVYAALRQLDHIHSQHTSKTRLQDNPVL